MADIIDGCKRTHAAHHLQIILQPLDSVTHITLILIKVKHIFPGDPLIIQTLPAQIPFGTVQHRKQILTKSASHGKSHITEQISGDPVLEQIWNLIPHPKWQVILHQLLDHDPWLGVGAINDRYLAKQTSPCLPVLNLSQNISTLLLLIWKFQAPHQSPISTSSYDVLRKPGLIPGDHPTSCLYNLCGRAKIIIQQYLS